MTFLHLHYLTLQLCFGFRFGIRSGCVQVCGSKLEKVHQLMTPRYRLPATLSNPKSSCVVNPTMTRSSSLLYIPVNGFSEWPCQDVQYLLLRSWVKSSVFDEVHGNTMSLKEHVEEFMMFHPFLFRSTKTIKHLQLYNKNNHNYNPTTHNHLGPPIWSLPRPEVVFAWHRRISFHISGPAQIAVSYLQ